MAGRMPVDLDKMVAVRDALHAALDTLSDVFPATMGSLAEPARAADDGKTTTSIRIHIHPGKLFALQTLAHQRRCRVNDLVLEGIDHVLDGSRRNAPSQGRGNAA
jgi:hypothetical protein